MNDSNMKTIREFILTHALDTQHRLPPDPRHPKGRNAIYQTADDVNSFEKLTKPKNIPQELSLNDFLL